MKSIDGDGGVGAATGKPGAGEIPGHEPGPADQPERVRPVRGVTDCDAREIHSHQRGIRFPGEPESRTAASASQIDECLSRREAQGLRYVAEQAGRDKGERLDLGRQLEVGQFPHPPEPGRCRHGRKGLVEVGSRRRGRAGRCGAIVLVRWNR